MTKKIICIVASLDFEDFFVMIRKVIFLGTCSQVSRPHISHDLFLEEALARYKGFLHLIRRNKEKSIRRFCVPTYDIDLMWHSHQLHPVSYCEDLIRVHGKVLEHDDMDSDRSKGQKLDVGFSGTTNQWEETFGKRYWRAGAMYRGAAPSPVTLVPFSSKSKKIEELLSSDEYQNIVQVPDVKFVEVVAAKLRTALFVHHFRLFGLIDVLMCLFP